MLQWISLFSVLSNETACFLLSPEELKESMVLSPEARSFIVTKSLAKAEDYQAVLCIRICIPNMDPDPYPDPNM